MRPPIIRLHSDELIVDNFAGGGGASTGIEWAMGRSPDIAINHDPEAIAMHAANHPTTKHYCESVWEVNPVEACGGRPVGLAWFSPDCTFHSKARGSKPFRDRDVAKRRRGLAWIVVRWAKAVKPRVIAIENVEELEDWGPLLDDGRPDPLKRGFTFRRWKKTLENCGYVVELKQMRACDYGAPTSRKRLFIMARCDGQPIVWPEPTHGKGRSKPHRTAAECIDWNIPVPSIFDRQKPLAENTMRRIARGIKRYVYEDPTPFLVPVTHTGVRKSGPCTTDARIHSLEEPFRTITGANRGEQSICVPTLIQMSWGERKGQAPRVPGLEKPIGTLMAQGNKHALVAAFLAKHFGGEHPNGKPKCPGGSDLRKTMDTVTARDHHSLVTSHLVRFNGSLEDRQVSGSSLEEPLGTITAQGFHYGQVVAFLLKYFGTDQDPRMGEPLHTITTKDRFALVTIAGIDYAIVDIGMRMLAPHELFAAQGFKPGYIIDPVINGKPMTKTAQVRCCGNSVCPPLVEGLLAANFEDRAAAVGE